jgi:hypothetical protein
MKLGFFDLKQKIFYFQAFLKLFGCNNFCNNFASRLLHTKSLKKYDIKSFKIIY